MASPLVEYCEQANPGVLLEIRRVGATTGNARRVQASFLADLEKKALIWGRAANALLDQLGPPDRLGIVGTALSG